MRFRPITAQPGGAPGASVRASAAAFGGRSALALQALGEAGQQATQDWVRVIEARDELAAQRRMAQLRERAIARMDELHQSGEPVTEAFTEYLQTGLAEVREQATTASARSYVDRTGANIAADLGHAARRRDAELAGQEAQETSREFLRANTVSLARNPESLGQILEEQAQFVATLDVPENVRPGLLREMQRSAAMAAAQGWIQLDPEAAKTLIEDGRYDQYIDGEDRLALIARADTRIRGLSEQRRVEEAEAANRRGIASDRLTIELLSKAHSGELTMPEIIAASEQLHDNGEPMLDPARVDRLFNLRRQMAEEGTLRTDPAVAVSVIARLDSISPTELTALAESGLISPNDFERWLGIAQEGDTPLRSVRGEFMRRMPDLMGIPADMVPYTANLGRVQAQMVQLAYEREEEYRTAGKNPIEYYQDGTFERDARTRAREVGIPLAGMDRVREGLDTGRPPEGGLQRGEVVDGLVYLGGPLLDEDGNPHPDSWVNPDVRPADTLPVWDRDAWLAEWIASAPTEFDRQRRAGLTGMPERRVAEALARRDAQRRFDDVTARLDERREQRESGDE